MSAVFSTWKPRKQEAPVSRTTSIQSMHVDLDDYLNQQDSLSYNVYPGTEPENYDFTAERHLMYGTNLLESTAHLIKGCIGAGVLSIHVAFMQAGIWAALIFTVLMGVIMTYSMSILVRSAHRLYLRLRVPRLFYPDIAEAALATGPVVWLRRFGKSFRYLIEICLFAEMCGSCCIYEIMIAKSTKKFLETVLSSVRESDMSLRYYILIVAAPLILICLIRNLKYLAPFSFMADILIVICVCATMYYSLLAAGKITERPAWKSFHGFLKFCGICLFSMDGITVILPVENNMKEPKYFFFVLKCGMTIVVVLLICTGFFGYWGWGEECKSPITSHMPADIVPLILQCLIVLMLNVTFAVHFWVPFRVIWHYVGKRYTRKRSIWERFYRAILVLVITVISVGFPHLMTIMIFLGNFFLGLTAVIFPAVIASLVLWQEYKAKSRRWMLLINMLIIALGIFFCCGAFYSAIYVS